MTAHAHSREVIAVDNLVQTIGGQEILRGFSLKVYQGETLVLLGRSGGGKSVFLRHLIGLMQPVSGTVTVDHRNISLLKERELADVRRSMGMLFQNGALFDSLTVDGAGNIWVATIPGRVTKVSPDGSSVIQYEMPDTLPTNVVFGPGGDGPAYITLSSGGKLIAFEV